MYFFSFWCPLVFTLIYCRAEPVIDVDIQSASTSFAYTADIDSQQLEYRCLSGGSADGLIWRYNNVEYTNQINAYEFYGVVTSIGTYNIGCYSGGNSIGDMVLTLKDIANFTVEYFGSTSLYSLSSDDYYTISIPVNTDVIITCEVSTGIMSTPTGGIIGPTTNPSTTFPLTNTTGSGPYKCARGVFGKFFAIITLDIVPGVAVTTITTTQYSTTTQTTTPTTPSTPTTQTTPIIPTNATITQTTPIIAITTTVSTPPVTSPTITHITTTIQSITTITPPLSPVSIHLSYTPNYNTVFVGYDDVTITCITDSTDNITITLIDVSTDSILISLIGNQASILLELMKGNITHKCSVQTDTGLVLGEQTADLRVEDIYTQEVVNLHTIIPSSRGVRLVWGTSYPQLANEMYIISVYSVNESIQHKDITTNMTEYYLTDVSYTFHYTITVEVMNRLNNTNNSTQMYYIHNQLISKPSTLYGMIGLIAGVLILILLVIIIVFLIIILVLKRRKVNKHEYTKQDNSPPKLENVTPSKEYIQLSDIHTLPSRHQTNYKYEPMASIIPIRDEYVEVSLLSDSRLTFY